MLPMTMITIKNPALIRKLAAYAGGLFPEQLLGAEPHILIVKCSKEMILTAEPVNDFETPSIAIY